MELPEFPCMEISDTALIIFSILRVFCLFFSPSDVLIEIFRFLFHLCLEEKRTAMAEKEGAENAERANSQVIHGIELFFQQ